MLPYQQAASTDLAPCTVTDQISGAYLHRESVIDDTQLHECLIRYDL